MQILAITRRRTERFSDAEFAAVLDDEAETARRLYAEGCVRAIHGRGDVPGAVLVVEAASLDDARATIGRLPLARREMMDVDFVPLVPYRGFGPRG